MSSQFDVWSRVRLTAVVFHNGGDLDEAEREQFSLEAREVYDGLSEAYRHAVIPHMIDFVQHNDAQKALDAVIWTLLGRTTRAQISAVQDGVENLDEQLKALEGIISELGNFHDDCGLVEWAQDLMERLSALRLWELKATRRLVRYRDWQRSKLSIKRKEVSLGESWVGGWPFALEGSFGVPRLWVKLNKSGEIIDVSDQRRSCSSSVVLTSSTFSAQSSKTLK